MRIGILGGTFNPPHRGHLGLARAVLDRDLVDSVVLIPASVPPHKAAPDTTSTIRLAMTQLLAKEDPRLAVDALELERVGPSYTVDTVTALRKTNPTAQFRLIIGSDMAKIFATWFKFRELLTLAPPLVAERPGDEFSSSISADYPGMSSTERAIIRSGVFDMPPIPISSTAIREMVRNGADDDLLLSFLTEPVLHFIRSQNLYR